MYNGQAPWTDDYIKSLRLETSIALEFTNIALNEMELSVTLPKLNDMLGNATNELAQGLQLGIAMGEMIAKPTIDSTGNISVKYYSQGDYTPIRYDSNSILVEVVFTDVVKQDTSNYYIRLEHHNLMGNTLYITNKAYKSSDGTTLGRQVDLSVLEQWASILPEVTYQNVQSPIYGYYKNPIPNTIDHSNCGVSIYDNATELIQKADKQLARLDWEFESSERAIHVDDTAIKHDTQSVAKLNKRLYRGLNLSTSNGDELLKEFSPQVREQSVINGLNEYKHNIEFAVGLSYGDLSHPQAVEKTATEVKASKLRKYNTVIAIQRKLEICLKGLCYAIAFYTEQATTGYDIAVNFKDSILTDEEAQRTQDIKDLSLGIMRPEEYRAKWYGETVEQAQGNLPSVEQVDY